MVIVERLLLTWELKLGCHCIPLTEKFHIDISVNSGTMRLVKEGMLSFFSKGGDPPKSK